MGSMKGPREDRGLLSRLPDEAAYWDGLTDRIVADAVPRLGSLREEHTEWWSAMGRFSTVLATAAAAAVIAAIAVLPAGSSEQAVPFADALGLAPDDPLAAPVLMAEAPPAVEVLLRLRLEENGR